LNEAILVMNKTLQVSYYLELSTVSLTRFQEINKQNMNIELVAQMFKNYQSNVLFHLEG
jgi:DASH complex subunit DAD4